MFLAALFTIAGRWKHPKDPLTDKKMLWIHAFGILLSHEKAWSSNACSNMVEP